MGNKFNIKDLNKVMNKIRNMTADEIESKIFHLNGHMNIYLFDRIIRALIECKYLDQEDLYYNYSEYEKYHISSNDFDDVWNYLDRIQLNSYSIVDSIFPSYYKLFSYNHHGQLVYIIHHIMIGQGSIQSLELITDFNYISTHKDYKNIKVMHIDGIDESLKFYKKDL